MVNFKSSVFWSSFLSLVLLFHYSAACLADSALESHTKGAGSVIAAKTIAFKLLKEAEKRWKKICGIDEIKNLLLGLAYKDGCMVSKPLNQEVPAA